MGVGSFELSFVGVGPQRTASTWLDVALRRHPDVELPRLVKETMFFDEHYDKGLSWFVSHFDVDRPDTVAGEIGPTYFDSEEARARIAHHFSKARIIVGVRDPVARAVSMLRHYATLGAVPTDVDEAIEGYPRLITSGRYHTLGPAWEKDFGTENVLYIVQDDISTQPDHVLAALTAFLGIANLDSLDPARLVNEALGASPRSRAVARAARSTVAWLRSHKMHRIVDAGKRLGLKRAMYGGGPDVEIDASAYERLRTHFEPDVAWLEQRLNRSFEDWRVR